MNMAAVFSDPSFSVAELSGSLEAFPAIPGKVMQMGLFKVSEPLTGRTAMIDIMDGQLQLLPTTPWGGAAKKVIASDSRSLRPFLVPHIYMEDEVLAADVQGVRAFGKTADVDTVASKVAYKLKRHRQFYDSTMEFHQVKALQGSIVDADGSTEILNLFTAFGQSQAQVYFDFAGSGSPKASSLSITRYMETHANGFGLNGVVALCSDSFFDALTAHAEVVEAWKAYTGTSINLQEQQDGPQGFKFGGITYINYSGSFGGVDYVTEDTATFFPLTSAELYTISYAPADWNETVNTPGKPYYGKAVAMNDDRGYHLWSQSNPLVLMRRPKLLLKGNIGAAP